MPLQLIKNNLWGNISKLRITTLILTISAEFLLFIATLTPSWQVAEDTDIHRNIQSGLWIYCPGQSQCWYIFSDDLINYYERVEVCRFLLIGDCRKKLLRTPYFFGWHYAVLILMFITLLLGGGAILALGIGIVKENLLRTMTIILDVLLGFAFLLCGIGLAVFMINGEMLESRYLIGVQNIFPKSYGYSFYLACWAMLVLLFALMSAILLTSSVFFSREVDAGSPVPYGDYDGEYNNKEILPPPILKWQQQEQQFEYPSQYYPETEGGNSRRIDDNSLIFRQPSPPPPQYQQSPVRFENYNNNTRQQTFQKHYYAPINEITSIP
uniref:Uncharacterized protein n=1 Tax=Meloidogyne floridensis TaxID=298350 RepID=A0A915P996_9BILA